MSEQALIPTKYFKDLVKRMVGRDKKDLSPLPGVGKKCYLIVLQAKFIKSVRNG